MRTKAPRFVVATLAVALISLAGVSSPAQTAAPAKPTARNVWCC